MIKNDQVYIEHILEAISKIENFVHGLTKFEFDRNVLIQDAVIRNFEIIGEATKKDLKTVHPITSLGTLAGYGRYERQTYP